jgi:hypothetical protein
MTREEILADLKYVFKYMILIQEADQIIRDRLQDIAIYQSHLSSRFDGLLLKLEKNQ